MKNNDLIIYSHADTSINCTSYEILSRIDNADGVDNIIVSDIHNLTLNMDLRNHIEWTISCEYVIENFGNITRSQYFKDHPEHLI